MALTQVDQGLFSSTAQYTGFKNRIINGDMRVAQRGTSGAASTGYTLDRWLIAYTGTAPTWAQASGTMVNGQTANLLQITGASGNTWVLTAQRIEAANSKDLAGQTVTVSYEIYQTTGSAMSLTTSLYYANSTDNFSGGTTLISNSAVQSIPSGAITKVTATFSIPSAATTGIELRPISQLPALGAGQVIQIGNVQLEKGSTATSFDYRPYGTELALCQRYYEVIGGINLYGYNTTGNAVLNLLAFKATKRATPTMATITLPNYSNSNSFATQFPSTDLVASYVIVTSTGACSAGGITQASISASAEL